LGRAGASALETSAGAGVLVIWWVFSSMVHQEQTGLPGGLAGWALLFVLQALLLTVSIMGHEAGHLIAGRLVGYRARQLTIGPLLIRRMRRGIRFSLEWRLSWLGGATVSVPTAPPTSAETEHLRWREAIRAAGGPIGSLILALGAAVPLVGYAERPGELLTLRDFWIIYVLTIVLIWSLAACVGNALPLRAGGARNDGANMIALLRGGDGNARFCALVALQATSEAGQRPRDWNATWLQRISTPADASGADDARMVLLAYLAALDRGDVTSARDHLQRALALPGKITPVMRARVALEAAYFTAIQGGAGSLSRPARWWMQQAKGAAGDPHTWLRVEAAVLLAEGRHLEAQACAEKGLRALARAVDTGIGRAEGAWLHSMLERARRECTAAAS
jgi:hypothetical protein